MSIKKYPNLELFYLIFTRICTLYDLIREALKEYFLTNFFDGFLKSTGLYNWISIYNFKSLALIALPCSIEVLLMR